MNRLLKVTLLAAVCAVAPGAVQAQGACPEGRMANGQCINPLLAESMRQAAMIFSQPKASQTAFALLPSFDWIFRYPHQLIPDQQKPSPVGTPDDS
jgi:hypothetical protein